MAGTGETVTYRELDARSNQGAHLFRSLGVNAGDSIAIFMDNHPRYYEVLWAAQRSGLRFTCISSKLTVGRGRVHRQGLRGEGAGRRPSRRGRRSPWQLAPLIPGVKLFMVDGAEAALREPRRPPRAEMPDDADRGRDRRRGRCSIRPAPPAGPRASSARARPGAAPIDAPNPLAHARPGAVRLERRHPSICRPRRSTTPPRSAGRWRCRRMGGTVVVMERFDAEEALALHRAVQGDLPPSGCRPTSCAC